MQGDRVRVDVNDIFVPCPKCGLGMHFLSDKKHDCNPELKELLFCRILCAEAPSLWKQEPEEQGLVKRR